MAQPLGVSVQGNPVRGRRDVPVACLKVPDCLAFGPYCLEIWQPIANPPLGPVAQNCEAMRTIRSRKALNWRVR